MPKMKQAPQITPPSAPLLGNFGPEPDDIPDTFPVPPGMADHLMASPTPGLPAASTGPEPVETRITSDASVAGPPGSMTPAQARAAQAVVQSLPTQIPPEAPTKAQEPSLPPTPPAVPPTVPALPDAFLPLAHGFCQYLQGVFGAKLEEAAMQMTKEVGVTLDGMVQYTRGIVQCNEHAEVQLSDALRKLFEQGITVHGSPYEMRLCVQTPAGIPLVLTIRKTNAAELLDELTRLETWLSTQGYTGEKIAGATF